MADSIEEHTIPLHHQTAFGSGLKRKRVTFIPATATPLSVPPSAPRSQAGDLYLSIVGAGKTPDADILVGNQSTTDAQVIAPTQTQTPGIESELEQQRCQVCNLPLQSSDQHRTVSSKPHEASIAHQICLEHSYPPSHLDRDRQGVKILSSYGWDPDSRLGLGKTGEGIKAPIKAVPKNETVGLGAKAGKVKTVKKTKDAILDAGQVRRMHAENKRKTERLRELFYGKDDIQKYLGQDG